MQILVKANQSASAYCYVTFSASLNALETTTASVFVDTELTAPVPVTYCPQSRGYQCIMLFKEPSTCVLQPSYTCADMFDGCYACETGVSTLPSSIALTVGLNQPVASFEKQIALDSPPEECKIEGFESNPSYLPPSTYGGMYSGVSNDYWSYQNNPYQQNNQPYTGYQQNQYLQLPSYNTPGINPNAPLTTGYGGSPVYSNTGYSPYASSNLPYPPYAQPYCPPSLNTQALGGSYYSSSYGGGAYGGYGGSASYGRGGFPQSYPSNFQYPAYPTWRSQACGTSAQPTAARTTSIHWRRSQLPIAMPIPAICTNPDACPVQPALLPQNQPYPQSPYTPSPFNYPQSKPPISVRVESCTQTNLLVTAEYTGNDYFYSGALGGTQNGFLLIKASGQQQNAFNYSHRQHAYYSIPSVFTIPPYPMSPNIMPQCMPTYPPFEYGTTDDTGLDENGLPSEIALKMNEFSKKATYKREIQPRYPGTSLQKTEGFKENTIRVESFAPTLKITAKPRSKTTEGIESESGDLLVSFPSFQAQKQIKIPTSVQEDDFGVKYMALFVNKEDNSPERKPGDDKIKAYYSDLTNLRAKHTVQKMLA